MVIEGVFFATKWLIACSPGNNKVNLTTNPLLLYGPRTQFACDNNPRPLLTLRINTLTEILPNALVTPDNQIQSEWAPSSLGAKIRTLAAFHFY